MAQKLIIAEKPSVANDIARVLGGFTRHGDYYESRDYVLSSAIGHLLELVPPEGVEVKRGKWSFAHLPVIPPHFDLKTIERTEERFEQLRKDRELRPLADAALCRSESDWLIGINGTRAMTAFNSKGGGFYKTTVGRVQTPTLAILVEREDRIRSFKARDYWEIHATFAAAAGEYAGRWFDENFQKEKEDVEAKPERLWEEKRAAAIRAKCLGKPGVATEEAKPASQLSPLLYDLTSLQREANGRFGFSAKTTLALAQALYERHKALTYPRTDSRALPEDYLGTVKKTLDTFVAQKSGYTRHAAQILKKGWVKPNKRIFDNKKISDHFAIIPTIQRPRHISEAEGKLYDLVVKRFLAVFFPAAEYLVTTRITRVEGEAFKTEGRVMTQAGWLEVYGKEAETGESLSLVAIEHEEKVRTREVDVRANRTKPPARFTEATLLSAMEGAGKLVEDEELREAMSEKGLGTPATRAAIIEGLIYEKYVLRLAKDLQPTAKAFSLITLLRGLGVPELCSPELTGDWEFKLRKIQRGQMQRHEFMEEIAAVTRHIVEQAKGYESDTVPGDFSTLQTPCPKCGGVVKENYKKFQCQSCDFSLWKIAAGRQFEIS